MIGVAEEIIYVVYGAIAAALFFDFVNGFHDAANSIATVVGTRVLRPLQAVTIAAVANFAGPFIFGTAVAATVGKRRDCSCKPADDKGSHWLNVLTQLSQHLLRTATSLTMPVIKTSKEAMPAWQTSHEITCRRLT